MNPEPPSNLSFQATARGLIADRAKQALNQLLRVHPSEAPAMAAAAVVDQLINSLCIMHAYRIEQMTSIHSANSFLFEQMQELLDTLMQPASSLPG